MSFIFGGNTGMSYEDIQRKRKIVEQMLSANAQTPQNVGEGLSAIGRALAARAIEKRTSRRMGELEEEAERKWRDSLKELFGGVGQQSAPMYGAGAANAPATDYIETVPTVPKVSTTNLDTGETDSSETSLTPDVPAYSPEDRIELARTIQAEAGNQGLEGMVAVGSVVRNRVQSPDYGSTWDEVQMAPGQFSARNSQTGYARGEQGQPMNFMPNETALRAADIVLAGGADPTGGATHYFNPAISQPSWARGANFKPIGDHVFGSVSAPGSGGRAGVRGAVPAGGGNMQGRIAQALALAELASDPLIARDKGKMAVINALLGQVMDQPDPVRGVTMGNRLVNPVTGELMADFTDASGGSSTEYGLTPQYIVTEDGQLQMLQLSKDGTAKVVDLPEGAAIQKGVEKLDLGTAYQWYNTITGEPIGQPIPKALAEAESQKAQGKVEGEAIAQSKIDAPQVIAKGNETIALIDSIVSDPNLPGITGKIEGRLDPEGLSGLILSQEEVDLAIKVKQLQGKAFLEAFETLKGGGQITEREGLAAQAAIARLQRVQGTEEYKRALNELRTIAENGVRRARGEDVPEYTSDISPEDDGVPVWNAEKGVFE